MTTVSNRSDYERAIGLLLERINYERAAAENYGEREYKLDRMRELLARLGHPERGVPIVHIAGTKGKGSTAAMAAAVLTAAGYRTGLYSSPHLHRIEERMMIDGHACSPERFVTLVELLRPAAAQMDAVAASSPLEVPPTYFELTTALALLHFAGAGGERPVDACVLEVGMGGRLDSTNVCQSWVSVITSISYDHTKQLGNTLALIAREKAGIAKPGVPLVSGVVDDEPAAVIDEVCRREQSPLIKLGREFAFDYRPPQHLEQAAHFGQLDYRSTANGQQRVLAGLSLGLVGRHQAANAAVALAALEQLEPRGFATGEAAIRQGLAAVRWPARVEVVSRQPTVVVDASHNVASVAALLGALDESFASRRRLLVFAGTREKDGRGMLALLLPRFDRVIFTAYRHNPRNVPPDELQALAEELGARHTSTSADPKSAWQESRAWAEADDLICVTGSFFIAAEMRDEIGRSPAN